MTLVLPVVSQELEINITIGLEIILMHALIREALPKNIPMLNALSSKFAECLTLLRLMNK